MDDKKYESLRLENQLCFPLYAAAKEVVKKYRVYLDQFDITYTQYITLMVLWEFEEMSVKELGTKLYLDSGTLTPLLKNLENKGYITRKRSDDDERYLQVKITKKALELREQLLDVPSKISQCVNLHKEEAMTLYNLLYKVLHDNKK